MTRPQLNSKGRTIKERQDKRVINKYDPIYQILNIFIFRPFFRPRLANSNSLSTIEIPEIEILLDNLYKHRTIAWINILAALLFYSQIDNFSNVFWPSIIQGISAPTIVLGIAWYTISFSGVQERFVRAAMLVTGVLFLGSTLSTTLLFLTIAQLTPTFLNLLILPLIYFSIYFSAILYDNLDALRATTSLDKKALSRTSPLALEISAKERNRISTTYLKPSNIDIAIEIEKMIDQHLEDISSKKPAMIANALISDCLSKLTKLLELAAYPLEFDNEYSIFLTKAHSMTVNSVNQKAVLYLRIIIERVHSLMERSGNNEDISIISSRLNEIERIRSKSLNESKDSHSDHQELADHLFVEVFRQILSIIRANHWIFLLKTEKKEI